MEPAQSTTRSAREHPRSPECTAAEFRNRLTVRSSANSDARLHSLTGRGHASARHRQQGAPRQTRRHHEHLAGRPTGCGPADRRQEIFIGGRARGSRRPIATTKRALADTRSPRATSEPDGAPYPRREASTTNRANRWDGVAVPIDIGPGAQRRVRSRSDGSRYGVKRWQG